MGVVGIVWAIDCLIALVLAFPNPKSWRKSFAFRVPRRLSAGATCTARAACGGGLLLVVAVTSISMNLAVPVVRPLVSLVSPLAETPYTNPEHFRPPRRAARAAARADRRIARAAGRDAGFAAPPGALLFAPAMNAYAVGFFTPGNDHGDVGRQCVALLGRRDRQARRRRCRAAVRPATCSCRRSFRCTRADRRRRGACRGEHARHRHRDAERDGHLHLGEAQRPRAAARSMRSVAPASSRAAGEGWRAALRER